MKKSKYGSDTTEIIIVIVFTILIMSLSQYLYSNHNSLSSLGVLGDFMGGLVGTVISIFTLYYLFKTYKTQKKEVEQAKEHSDKQQFEAIYFQMLNTFYTMGNDITGVWGGGSNTNTGKDYFKQFVLDIDAFYSFRLPASDTDDVRREIYDIVKNIADITDIDAKDELQKIKIWTTRKDERYKGLMFEYIHDKYKGTASHYFRYLYTVLKFVIDHRTKYNDVKAYTDMIQAQMTNDQLILLHCFVRSTPNIGIKNIQPEMKKWVDEYRICENMDTGYVSHMFLVERSSISQEYNEKSNEFQSIRWKKD